MAACDTSDNPAMHTECAERLFLSTRACNCLWNFDILKLADLTTLSRKDLLAMPHLGAATMREIEGGLARLGLSLRGEAPRPPPPGVVSYTAEDYETALRYPETRRDHKLVSAALRIAAATLRTGVIETALVAVMGYQRRVPQDEVSDAIRKALIRGRL